jgi:hypothetical protein
LTRLTSNYLKVELASPRVANRIADLRIGGLGQGTLLELNPLRVL